MQAFLSQCLSLAVLMHGTTDPDYVRWRTWTLDGHVEEWHIPREPQVSECVTADMVTMERQSAQHQAVLAMFLGFRNPLYSCAEGMCHSSTCPPNIRVCHCM